jgi:hypothetical protein
METYKRRYILKSSPRFSECKELQVIPTCAKCGMSLNNGTIEDHLAKKPNCQLASVHYGLGNIKWIEIFVVRIEC